MRLVPSAVLRRAVHRQYDGLRLRAIGLHCPDAAGAPSPYDRATAYA